MSLRLAGSPLLGGAKLGLEPDAVLVEYDGPRLFTTKDADGRLLLAYVCDEDESERSLLVVPTSQAIVDQLVSGARTVRDALTQPWVWLVVTDHAGTVVEARSISVADVPEQNLPREGAALAEREPALRIRLTGKDLRKDRVTATTARTALEAVINAFKVAIDHVSGEAGDGGRPRDDIRRVYDLPIQEFGFASFAVSFRLPEPGARQETMPTVAGVTPLGIAEAAAVVRDALAWGGKENAAPPDTARTVLLLRVLDSLTPPHSGVIEEVEVSGSLVSQACAFPVRLTREDGTRVRRLLRHLTETSEDLVSVTGVIEEFDRGKLTFTLRHVEEAGLRVNDLKCSIDEQLYDDVMEYFPTDRRVTVAGIRARAEGARLHVLLLHGGVV